LYVVNLQFTAPGGLILPISPSTIAEKWLADPASICFIASQRSLQVDDRGL